MGSIGSKQGERKVMMPSRKEIKYSIGACPFAGFMVVS
jgi:hypothetical protein